MRVELVSYDPAWPQRYEREAARLGTALGVKLLSIDHVGSTSVPGLSAKPIIDIVIAVPDSSDEAQYVPELEDLGYRVRVREPEWFEHRVLRGPQDDINLHVFTLGAAEIDRMISFRDRLRASQAALEMYQAKKRELARQEWESINDYSTAKSEVIEWILAAGSG